MCCFANPGALLCNTHSAAVRINFHLIGLRFLFLGVNLGLVKVVCLELQSDICGDASRWVSFKLNALIDFQIVV